MKEKWFIYFEKGSCSDGSHHVGLGHFFNELDALRAAHEKQLEDYHVTFIRGVEIDTAELC